MAQAQVESASTEVEMEEDQEDMDEDTSEDNDVDSDEEGDEDSEEDSGCPRMKLADIKTAQKIPQLAVFVTVVKRSEMETKKGRKQFTAVVADETSAVDICVTNKYLFDKFEDNSGLILENVEWSGHVLFLNESANVTSIAPIKIDQSLVKEAFGQGDVVSIKEALALEPKSWVALKGKIEKQSDLTKKYSFEKLMAHRQIKLTDRTGSVYVDVWKVDAINLESGDVIHMTGCKRKKSESVGKSAVTTTKKTCVKKLKTTDFVGISINRFQRAKLEEIEVDIYRSCPEPGCYHFKLDDNNLCESCGSTARLPDCYATAQVVVTTRKYKIQTLTVFWPQLRELYKMFDRKISLQADKSTFKDEFRRHLQDKTVKYVSCGNVTKFKL